MKLVDIDLNLLVVFHQLLRERRVSLVGETLGMSQPAVSNALRRLRDLLGDELFLRTPRGMAPTPYALQLAQPVAQALDTLQGALNVRASFNTARSERCFTLAMTDVGETYFLPVLMDALARTAPGVTLRCVPVADPTLREDMASGRVDLALGMLPRLQAGFFQQVLFRQQYVALMRDGHPLAARRQIGVAPYRQAAHVRVVSAGTGHGQVDESLERQGLARSIQLTVPHYTALGHVLGSTDLIATVPERLAERMLQPFGLKQLPHPVDLPRIAINVFWHAKYHKDPASQWLRKLVIDLHADDQGAPARS